MSHVRSLAFAVVFGALFFAANAVRAHDGNANAPTANAAASGQLVPVNDKADAVWLAKARADYPLTSCIVSGDKFDGGEMGKQMDFVYKQDGKADCLVRFCCKDCVKGFRKEPTKYLKAIDDAATKQASRTR